jgi:YggT family protein
MIIICPLLEIYIVCVFARFVLSWFPPPRDGFMATANGFLFSITEPVLRPARRLIPPMGMFDVSGTLVLVALFILHSIICG